MIQAAAVIFGLIIGSFLTVCIFRVPFGREKGPGTFGQPGEHGEAEKAEAAKEEEDLPEGTERLSIYSPRRSFCPSCRAQLVWWENVPFFSWILLRGRCRHCQVRISVMYPAVELLSAVSAVLAYSFFDPATATVVYLFCAALIVLSFIDAEYYILPNVITIPGMVIGFGLALLNQFTGWFGPPVVNGVPMSLWGLFAGGGFLFLVSEVYFRLRKRVGLGFGDVKLLAMVGLLFGPEVALGTIFLGSIVGTVGGVAMLLLGGHGLSKPLPFGPYLAIGAFICLYMDAADLLSFLTI